MPSEFAGSSYTESYNNRSRNLYFGKEKSEEIGVEGDDGKSSDV